MPTLGLGIKPRGPRIWPKVPTIRIASGAAITMSKGISPALTKAAKSSIPTTSAPAALASSALAPWANTATRLVLPVPLGNNNGATHHLVRLLGIDAQLHSHVDGFIELGVGEFLHQTQRHLSMAYSLFAVDLANLGFFAFLVSLDIYTPSTFTPMERAEPAMVRTAASRSAAVMSFILVFAISSSWARVILPNLVDFRGFGLNLCPA